MAWLYCDTGGKKFHRVHHNISLHHGRFLGTLVRTLPRNGTPIQTTIKIYTGTVAFGKIDIQNNQHIAKRYKISGIPHIILFHNGKPLTSITGVRSIGDLKDTIEAHLKKTKK